MKRVVAIAIVLSTGVLPAQAARKAERVEIPVTPPPRELVRDWKLSKLYRKHASAGAILPFGSRSGLFLSIFPKISRRNVPSCSEYWHVIGLYIHVTALPAFAWADRDRHGSTK